MLDIRNTLIAAAGAFIIGVLTSWYVTAEYKNSKFDAMIAKQKIEAAKELQDAYDRAILAERKNINIAMDLEVQNAQNRNKLDKALADNRRLSSQLGGLRDPGYRAGGNCTMPTGANSTGISVAAPTSGRLSAEASEFLLDFARDADRAAEYAATCHEWIKAIDQKK